MKRAPETTTPTLSETEHRRALGSVYALILSFLAERRARRAADQAPQPTTTTEADRV